MRTFKEDLEKDLRDPEFAKIFHKEWRAMTDKKYGDVMVRQEHGQVILSNPSMTKPLIISHDVWRAIVADNVKEVMRGEGTPYIPYQYEGKTTAPDGVTILSDTKTGEV